ncbi:MAG: BatD family protein [Dokdonella sp.]
MKSLWMRAICVLFLLPMVASAQTSVRAWLDRDTARMGESVTLNVEADSRMSAEPDFSVLDGEFTRVGTQSSQQVSIVNGQTTSKTLWAVGLEPRREGTLTIPAISVGTETTQPLTLTVLAQPAGAQGRVGDDVFLQATADPINPYVQQQVRYSVKLYYAFDLSDGNLGEPNVPGLVARRTGQDKRYVATLGSQRYNVIERNYALTPEQSGTLTIPAIEFRGSAIDARDPGSFFNRGRVVGARSDAISLNVAGKPATWGIDPWLPAEELNLTEDSQFPAEIHVGDALTRSVRVQAKGLGYEQLPDPEFPSVAGVDIYPDKSQTATRDDGTWIYGERDRKFAFVPNKAGTITLPAISIRWFNTATKQAETATLPERTINVLPATGAATAAPTKQAATDAASSSSESPATASTGPVIGTLGASGSADDGRWRWLALIATALWLLTVALWFLSARRRRSSVPTAAAPQPSKAAASARAEFLRSCALGDLVGAERGLIAWGRAEHAHINNLDTLAKAVDSDEQRDVLHELQQMRYSGAVVDGLAQRLQNAFRDGPSWTGRITSASAKAGPLPELYPS